MSDKEREEEKTKAARENRKPSYKKQPNGFHHSFTMRLLWDGLCDDKYFRKLKRQPGDVPHEAQRCPFASCGHIHGSMNHLLTNTLFKE